MKKLFIFAIASFLFQSAFAQIELTPYYGWQWTGSIPMYSYPPYYSSQNGKVDDKANYGVRLGTTLPSQMFVEFEWNHTETAFSYRTFDGEPKSIPVTANYYWLGGIRNIKEGNTVPYGIFNIGAANFKNTDSENNATYFAVGFGFGVKHFINETVGIRLQARIFAPMAFSGVYFGCGISTSGGGCGSGVSSYSTIIQGDFTGGVVLRLGNK